MPRQQQSWRGGTSSSAPAAPAAPENPMIELLDQNESRDARTLFLGNLDKRVTRKMIYELAILAGPVEAISLRENRSTNRFMAFVQYEHAVCVRYSQLVLRNIQLFRSPLHLDFAGSLRGRDKADFPPTPCTFFECPPGFDDSPPAIQQKMIQRKHICDRQEYLAGYYRRSNHRDHRTYPNANDNGGGSGDDDDDNYYYRTPQRDHRKSRNPESGHHRRNGREDHHPPARTPRGDSSYPNHRQNSSRAPTDTQQKRSTKKQHIRFGEEGGANLRHSDAPNDFFHRPGSRDGAEDHGERTPRSGKKPKKSRPEHRSSPSKRKRPR